MLLPGEAIYCSIYKHFAPHIPKNYFLSLRTCSMSHVIWRYVGGIVSSCFEVRWGTDFFLRVRQQNKRVIYHMSFVLEATLQLKIRDLSS